MDIYIQSAAQISVQKPLCNDFLTDPITYDVPYQRAIEADYKAFLDPTSSRRMGKILKRAIATSVTALRQSQVEQPDAIITGTGLGCIENTEKFLSAMVNEGEEFLQPTHFINSTHNTIGSQIALYLHCNGYNNTHVHLGTSFESALMDAFLLFQTGSIANALVGAHDEMTPDYFRMLERVGFWKGQMAGETAVSFVLSREPSSHPLGIVKDVVILYQPTDEQLSLAIDRICQKASLELKDIAVPPSTVPLFGASFTQSAFDLYASLFQYPGRNLLLMNREHGKSTSLTLIQTC